MLFSLPSHSPGHQAVPVEISTKAPLTPFFGMNASGCAITVGHHSASILRALTRLGLAGFECRNEREVLERLSSERCDLIVSDSNLPGSSATELLETVRRDYPQVAFVVCVQPRDLREALLARQPKRPSFKQYLLEMPNAGPDELFERGPQPDREVQL